MELGKKIRVLIVDDSAFMCRVLQSIINADPEMQVVGVARDGREAIAEAEKLRPDVITMDINMPHVDGLQATEVIMSSNPRPILIVSSESREGAAPTLRSLELGAIDFVPKPANAIDLDMASVRDELCRKLKVSAKVRVVRNAARSLYVQAYSGTPPPEPAQQPAPPAAPVSASTSGAAPAATPAAPSPDSNPPMAGASAVKIPENRFPVVCLAASTGGPATLMRLIPKFPPNFPGAVLLVQHIPGAFSSQFVEQLAEVSEIRVKEAEQGELMRAGTLYMCPGSHHLRVGATGRITLDDGPRISGYRPSADLTMETLAAFAGPMATAVVLTGMGTDGARGVTQVKAAGGYVIAQDEATSVIFGMPSEAIRTGVVDQVLPLDHIYRAIEKRVLYTFGAERVGAL
jgi:two-component system chemotaxis response regulator CheB